MATRNIEPNNNNEGGIGSAALRWLSSFFGSVNVTGDITDGTNTVTVAELKEVVDAGGGGGAVTSVNGETGAVELDAADVGASAIGHNHDDAYDATGAAATVQSNLETHTGNTANPHGVTAAQAGAIPTSEKGAANGVAELDASGKVLSAQLPSYVDDVLEYASTSSFPATGETGKIYIAQDTNKTYRWSGSDYAEISSSLALGETSSTAYRGDRGATAYTHSQVTTGNPHNVTLADVDGAPASHVGEGGTAHATATTSVAGFMLAADKTKLDGLESTDMLSTLVNSENSITGAATLQFGTMNVCSGITADYTVGLPAVSGNLGKIVGIRIAKNCTKLITVDGNGSEAVDGKETRVLWAGEVAILLCDGIGWVKIGGKTIPMIARVSADSDQSISSGDITIATMNTALIDNASLADLPNNRIVIRRAGNYMVSSGASMSSVIDWQMYQTSANPSMSISQTVTSATFAPPMSIMVSCYVADNVYLRLYHNSGGTVNTYNTPYPFVAVQEIPVW